MSSANSVDNGDPASSQELPLSSQLSNLSPPRPSMYGPNGRKERRQPSITPRKFNRFFTPRSLGSRSVSSARHALHEIAAPALNRNVTQSSPLRPFRDIGDQENTPTAFPRGLKRRKTIHTPEPTPEHAYSSSKELELGFMPLVGGKRLEPDDVDQIPSSPCARITRGVDDAEEEGEEGCGASYAPLNRIIPLASRGLGGQLLNRTLGRLTRSRRQHHVYPVNDWQDETASFYSRPSDVHISNSIESSERCIPFCTTSCNTNTLVAVGDEEGRVRLLESAKEGKPPFKDHYLAFRVHTNAIIDMSFSEDDSLLATASGDQSARVVDMSTQTTISILGNHSASLKQVRFQPGANNNSVLATSSRDGSVQIWDLRCRGNEGPQLPMHIPVEETSRVSTRSASRKFLYGRAINSIYYAHRPWSQNAQTAFPTDAPSRGEVPGRIGDLSVTAIQFLPPGQEHLLLTASEADASVRLWDIRLLHNRHKRPQMPISITKQPQSHSQWRHFGVSSLNLSGDGSRLYTLCKDNTIYAYSTSHLILGHAPELSATSQGRPSPQRRTQEGFGPMYGFRHPQLHATSFYVKSAIRKAKDGRSEMLAVGSSDGCAILFPTDERYLPTSDFRESQDMGFGPSLLRRPTLRRVGSGIGLGDRVEESIPISTNGTPLIRGHVREVGSLAWTSEGGLLTVGDDFLVRCWREGGDARDLRMGGESEGRRWGCGWADVNEKYDEADD